MKNLFKKIIKILQTPFILVDFFKFKKCDKNPRFKNKIVDFYPQILDKTIKTSFDRHYVYHTAWASRVLKEINPKKHIDISSSLYFSAINSSYIPIDFYDYRLAEIELENLTSKKGNLLALPFENESIESLSCMHTVEHIGLGRYGDEIDPEADLKAVAELQRVLAPGGSLIFVTPMGQPKICFNAHRIYSFEQVAEMFKNLEMVEFSLIPEKSGGIIRHANPNLVEKEKYACGCFWFKKIK